MNQSSTPMNQHTEQHDIAVLADVPMNWVYPPEPHYSDHLMRTRDDFGGWHSSLGKLDDVLE